MSSTRGDTTCTARTVDSAARGAFIGALWSACFSPRFLARSTLVSTGNVAGLVGLFTAVQCRARRSGPPRLADAAAGATAGAFYGMRVAGDVRTVATCALTLGAAGAMLTILTDAPEGERS